MQMQWHENQRFVSPADPMLRYTGRIGWERAEAPFFIFPCSMVEMIVTGRSLTLFSENLRSYFNNDLGLIVNGKPSVIPLTSGEQTIDLSGFLTAKENHVVLYKRQDGCHAWYLHGFAVDADARLLPLPPRSSRRMEVYGDSVSAGEVSEAEFACGQPDPEGHEGRYSNSWLSYAWQAARLMNAELHDIAQGGIALKDGTGWYSGPDYIGMLSAWDKVNYAPAYGPLTPWDFKRWTPQLVLVAIGQNDANPVNIMAEAYQGEAAAQWRAQYGQFIRMIREKYPEATIVLATTILGHHENWDRAIGEVCDQLRQTDPRVHHFLYTRNGCGTPGHVRGSEAAEMAKELAAFVDSLPDVWGKG